MPNARVFLALGAIAFAAVLGHVARATGRAPRAKFAHGAELDLGGGKTLLASYHVSQQNTQTGRLTASAFDAVLDRAATAAGL